SWRSAPCGARTTWGRFSTSGGVGSAACAVGWERVMRIVVAISSAVFIVGLPGGALAVPGLRPGDGGGLPARELLPEEGQVQRVHVRGLAVVRGAAVAAFDVLVVAHVLTGLEHLRHHLARMPGMHAVVAGGGEQQRRRVVLRRVEQVVGREGAD